MVLRDLDSYMQKKKKEKKLDHQLTPYTRINSKWTKDLNTNHDTIKVLEENIGRNISDIPCSDIFTNMFPRARDIKERINQWNLIKIISLCMAKENSIKMKKEPTVWENIFANGTSEKGLISKIYKELTRLHSRKKTTQLKMGKRPEQTLLQGRHTEGPETYEKMLRITSH